MNPNLYNHMNPYNNPYINSSSSNNNISTNDVNNNNDDSGSSEKRKRRDNYNDLIYDDDDSDYDEEKSNKESRQNKRRAGRPKGSKNKPKLITYNHQQRDDYHQPHMYEIPPFVPSLVLSSYSGSALEESYDDMTKVTENMSLASLKQECDARGCTYKRYKSIGKEELLFLLEPGTIAIHTTKVFNDLQILNRKLDGIKQENDRIKSGKEELRLQSMREEELQRLRQYQGKRLEEDVPKAQLKDNREKERLDQQSRERLEKEQREMMQYQQQQMFQNPNAWMHQVPNGYPPIDPHAYKMSPPLPGYHIDPHGYPTMSPPLPGYGVDPHATQINHSLPPGIHMSHIGHQPTLTHAPNLPAITHIPHPSHVHMGNYPNPNMHVPQQQTVNTGVPFPAYMHHAPPTASAQNSLPHSTEVSSKPSQSEIQNTLQENKNKLFLEGVFIKSNVHSTCNLFETSKLLKGCSAEYLDDWMLCSSCNEVSKYACADCLWSMCQICLDKNKDKVE